MYVFNIKSVYIYIYIDRIFNLVLSLELHIIIVSETHIATA